MQKFKVSKTEYDRAYEEYGPIEDMPAFIVMEGELLEGGTVEELQTEHWLGDAIGTVEKCTDGCDHYATTACDCPCHNKQKCCDKSKCSDFPSTHVCMNCFCHNKKEECNCNGKEKFG